MGDSVVSGMHFLWFVAPYGKGPALDYNINQIESAAYINKDLTLFPCMLEGLWKG